MNWKSITDVLADGPLPLRNQAKRKLWEALEHAEKALVYNSKFPDALALKVHTFYRNVFAQYVHRVS